MFCSEAEICVVECVLEIRFVETSDTEAEGSSECDGEIDLLNIWNVGEIGKNHIITIIQRIYYWSRIVRFDFVQSKWTFLINVVQRNKSDYSNKKRPR